MSKFDVQVGDRVRIEGVVKSVDNDLLGIRSDNLTDSHESSDGPQPFAWASMCQLVDSPLRPGDRVVETLSPTHRQYTIRSEVINGYVFVEPLDNQKFPNPFTSLARNLQRVSDASQDR